MNPEGDLWKRNESKKKSSQKHTKKGEKKQEIVEWTWDLIEELGLGRLRMKYDELYDMIPRAFWNAVDGYWLTKENEDRRAWERVRWQTCMMINMKMPKGKQISLQKLLRFDWEKEEINKNSYEKTNEVYQKHLKKQKSR